MDILILNDYSQFVWPAFVFTFLSCFFLYLKTNKEFKEQETIYLQSFKQLKTIKIKASKVQEAQKEVFSNS